MSKILTILTTILAINIADASEIKEMIRREEQKFGIKQGIYQAIVMVESNFNGLAVNKLAPVSSYGVSQVTAATFTTFCGYKLADIMDVAKNISCGARYLAFQLKRFGGNVQKAILAYNEGTPCECVSGIYKRVFKRRTEVCKKWDRNPEGKWSYKPLTCSNEGELRVTDYYFKVMRAHKIVSSNLN